MIKGKIVEIIDNRTVAINAGANKSVQVGMLFQIYSKEKVVIDPETKEELGQLRLPKLKIVVTKVEEKFSIAETYEFELINKGGVSPYANISSLLIAPDYVKKYQTFEMDEMQKKKIDEESSIVKLGDTVEQIEAEGNPIIL